MKSTSIYIFEQNRFAARGGHRVCAHRRRGGMIKSLTAKTILLAREMRPTFMAFRNRGMTRREEESHGMIKISVRCAMVPQRGRRCRIKAVASCSQARDIMLKVRHWPINGLSAERHAASRETASRPLAGMRWSAARSRRDRDIEQRLNFRLSSRHRSPAERERLAADRRPVLLRTSSARASTSRPLIKPRRRRRAVL